MVHVTSFVVDRCILSSWLMPAAYFRHAHNGDPIALANSCNKFQQNFVIAFARKKEILPASSVNILSYGLLLAKFLLATSVCGPSVRGSLVDLELYDDRRELANERVNGTTIDSTPNAAVDFDLCGPFTDACLADCLPGRSRLRAEQQTGGGCTGERFSSLGGGNVTYCSLKTVTQSAIVHLTSRLFLVDVRVSSLSNPHRFVCLRDCFLCWWN
jgi:hypothetical protein